MAFSDTKQFINSVVKHQDARGISKAEILADKTSVQARNKAERLKPRKRGRTGYGQPKELPESESSGGGGPYTEGAGEDKDGKNKETRTYYPTEELDIGDGILTIKVKPIKKIIFNNGGTFIKLENPYKDAN